LASAVDLLLLKAMRRTLLFFALGIGLTLTASGAAAPGSWIVFSATTPTVTVNQLFRIQTSGEGLQQITSGYLPAIAPAFSPDGKRVVFARTGSGLFVVSADGSGLRRLTNNVRDALPTFSPDGKSIAFIRPFKKQWGVYVMRSSGGPQRRLPRAPSAGRPNWLKAGLLIPSAGDLVRIDPVTGHVLKYFGAQIDIIYGLNTVAVAPNGSSLTFQGFRGVDPGDKECGEEACPRYALFYENLRIKGKPTKLTNDAGPAGYSPDGKTLVFAGKNALVLRPVAGGTSTTIATGDALPVLAAPPAWQPH